MPINQILPFAQSASEANGDLVSLDAYQSDPQRSVGNQEGLARRELVNRALRQATHMAAGLAQFIADNYAPGVLDDGDLDAVAAGLQAIIDAKSDTGHTHAIAAVTGLQAALDGKLATTGTAASARLA